MTFEEVGHSTDNSRSVNTTTMERSNINTKLESLNGALPVHKSALSTSYANIIILIVGHAFQNTL